jgi:acyl carrier protein
MTQAVSAQVIAILARQAVMDPARISPDMTPADLGLDSLGLVEVMFALEETFDISVPFNANRPDDGSFDTSSVGALVVAVDALIAQKP